MEHNVDKPTEEESQMERLLDPDAESGDKAMEHCKQMIAWAYLHVEMVRAQRLLYSELILMARHDGKSKVSHSECHHTFVVDYDKT